MPLELHLTCAYISLLLQVCSPGAFLAAGISSIASQMPFTSYNSELNSRREQSGE